MTNLDRSRPAIPTNLYHSLSIQKDDESETRPETTKR